MGRAILIAAWLAAVAVGSLSTAAGAEEARVDPEVLKDVENGGTARVIVITRNGDDVSAQSASQVVSGLLSNGNTSAAVAPIDAHSAVGVISKSDVAKLAASPSVLEVMKDVADPVVLEDTVRLIGAQTLWNTNRDLDGAGLTIAILDTGVDADHPFLAGKVVQQACFSVQDPSKSVASLCPSGGVLPTGDAIDLTATAARGCSSTIHGCEHGTHVAGIAAGTQIQDPNGSGQISGVAKGATIVAVQVFSRFDSASDCRDSVAPCILSFRSSQLRALQYVQSLVLNRQATDQGPVIAAVNMSIGGGLTSVPCDDWPLAASITALRRNGVATFVAAGNDGDPLGVSHPGCISDAITVGAVAKRPAGAGSDEWAPFSNLGAGRLVDLATVGVAVRSSMPGNKFGPLSGTSMATPVAAGAYTILKAAFPSSTVEEIESAMKTAGDPVKVTFTGTSVPAVNIDAAFKRLGGVPGAPADTAAVGSADVPTASAVSGSSSAGVGTRFIVEIPSGKAHEASAAIQELTAPEAGVLRAAPIDANTLTVTTDNPTKSDSLRAIIGHSVGAVGRITPDRADPASPSPSD